MIPSLPSRDILVVEFLGGWLKSKNDDFAAFFLVKDAQLENGGFLGTEGWLDKDGRIGCTPW